MNERQRHREPATAPDDSAPADGSPLSSVREQAAALHRAADRAIRDALSGDSEAFVRDSVQEGGQ